MSVHPPALDLCRNLRARSQEIPISFDRNWLDEQTLEVVTIYEDIEDIARNVKIYVYKIEISRQHQWCFPFVCICVYWSSEKIQLVKYEGGNI